MAEERQASYVLVRRSFCGATKENERKEKKENLHSASRFPERAEWVLQQVGRGIRGEIFDFVSFPESYIILQVCSDGTTTWLLQGSGI